MPLRTDVLSGRRAPLLLLALLLFAVCVRGDTTFTFVVAGGDSGEASGAWQSVLRPMGLMPARDPSQADVIVAPLASKPEAALIERARTGAIVVLEGESDAARALGIHTAAGQARIQARNAVDKRNPTLPIIWENTAEVARFDLPKEASVLVVERWSNAPLMAALRVGAGGVLWLAIGPGPHGRERFPYLPQALEELGVNPPLRSGRMWAFFDSSYRSRVDVDYFAERWRKAGIGALHVAAWHFYERDAQRDEYLRQLIEACHRNAILVYAWLELPHVSEQFWTQHPEWREKTALMQDAHLDWRRLMNLANRDCFRAVSAGVRDLVARHDWDGVNLAELYFESLEGASNAARFTPMNADVRREFLAAAGFDPLVLFEPGRARDAAQLKRFLEYRADLARRMQEEWLAEIEAARGAKPHLDVVLTHVDDRFDPRVRELIGADAERLLPEVERHDLTFLIEDPATVWHLGPERYGQIAARYRPLAPRPERLAIDINIVDRYQDVYPTKQQTGVELFQLVNHAARSFERVALYFEYSIRDIDWGLISAAGAAAARLERVGDQVMIECPRPLGLDWRKPASVDGRAWPVWDGGTLWLPRGVHVVEPMSVPPVARLLDLAGDLESAQATSSGFEFAYRSRSRALAVVDRKPSQVMVDGRPTDVVMLPRGGSGAVTLVLPRGEHQVRIVVDQAAPLAAAP